MNIFLSTCSKGYMYIILYIYYIYTYMMYIINVYVCMYIHTYVCMYVYVVTKATKYF
jgi:hypothetical protein